MQILINHVGYAAGGAKVAILQAAQAIDGPLSARLVSDGTVADVACSKWTQVAGWKDRWFSVVDFSGVCQPGDYKIRLDGIESRTFPIHEGASPIHALVSDILHYFKSQRCGGIYDRHDRACPLHGEDRSVDVHGGWYDASGDVSKYLSHLAYTNYMNPQQTPLVVWNLFKVHSLLMRQQSVPGYTLQRIVEEARHGADFLMRMQDPAGYFYMIVFDVWSKDVSRRDICSYRTQEGIKSAQFQAGFRQGGGMAIAALAAAAQQGDGNDYTAEAYLQAAVTGYWHLKQHNRRYLDDGEENIIDCYCALMAAVELYKATGCVDEKYLQEAREWASRLIRYHARCEDHGEIWFADEAHTRPYFHAVEAGLPGIALMQYIGVEGHPEKATAAADTLIKSISRELELANTPGNVFSYPQQVVQDLSGNRRISFFIPHHNESGYWWQGENARLGSLAAMAALAVAECGRESGISSRKLRQYATRCTDWILGLNPFDACMLDGYGWNNPTYWPEAGYHNAKGGICNGITSGFEDENDIALKPQPQDTDPLQNWRWGEQWMPHAAWFLLAVVALSTH